MKKSRDSIYTSEKRIKPLPHQVIMARAEKVKEVMGLWELKIYGN